MILTDPPSSGSSTRWSEPCANDGPHTEPAWSNIRTEVLNWSASDAQSVWSSPPSTASDILRRNALTETIKSLYKAEVIHRRGPWRSFEVVAFTTLEQVHWVPSGNILPGEAEALYYAILEQPAMAE